MSNYEFIEGSKWLTNVPGIYFLVKKDYYGCSLVGWLCAADGTKLVGVSQANANRGQLYVNTTERYDKNYKTIPFMVISPFYE